MTHIVASGGEVDISEFHRKSRMQQDPCFTSLFNENGTMRTTGTKAG